MSAVMFAAARAGDQDAIRGITLRCQYDKTMFSQLLPILVTHISDRIPPKFSPGSSPEAQEAILVDIVDPKISNRPVIQSIIPLAACIADGSLKSKAFLSQFIRKSWVPLHSWLSFIVGRLLQPDTPVRVSALLADRRTVLFTAISDILNEFLEASLSDPASMPGFGPLIIQTWLSAARCDADMKPACELYYLVGTLMYKAEDTSEIIGCIYDIADSVPLIVQEIQNHNVYDTSDMRYLPMSPPIALFSVLASTAERIPRSAELYSKLIAAGTIPAVISTLKAVCTGKFKVLERSVVMNVMEGLIGVIGMCLIQDPIIVHSQALDSGLLDVVVKALMVISIGQATDSLCETLDSVLEAIIKSQMHPPILRSLRRWYQRSDVPELRNHRDPKYHNWNAFVATIGRTLESRREYKSAHRPVCSNAKCYSDEIPVAQVKRCSGCLSAHYCSKECQKADWRQGHCRSCKPPNAIYSLAEAPMIAHDWVSWFFVAYASDKVASDPAFRDSISQARGSYPVMITYGLSVGEFVVMSGASFLASSPESEAAKLVLQHRKGDTLLCVRIPDTRVPFDMYFWLDEIN
ncbi:hypothetical protein C8J56DRAFT_1029843 [Mycena floridula]|nr:hypothetical protein C8J56DRAFT_1029843 [Mycena floridula]